MLARPRVGSRLRGLRLRLDEAVSVFSNGCMRKQRRTLDSHPLPGWLQHSLERYVGRVPLWLFPELGPTANLQFARLDFDNRDLVLDMFENDGNSFVDASFKDEGKLYEYVAHNRICGPYSPKHGCADWIVMTSGGAPAGLLHAYDFSRETWALNHRQCSIGYTIAPDHRGTGIAHEAVSALEAYLFETFDMLMLLAYPKTENERSVRFLQRRGYLERTEDFVDQKENRYFLRYRSPEAKRQMDQRYGNLEPSRGGNGRSVSEEPT
jgi:RimJ/RimL family protein N-acetyltransferase